MAAMHVAQRVAERRSGLTAVERRIADVLLGEPESIAFGTVAEIAARAGSSGASVVRLAVKLGFDGFSSLQSAVQADLAQRLRPATERIRQPSPSDLLGEVQQAEVENVVNTLARIDRPGFERAVTLLADDNHQVVALSGDASAGIVQQFAVELGMLRPGVVAALGSEVAVARTLAGLNPGDVVLVLDLRRYDRAVLDAVRRCESSGQVIIALTDRPMSPLARAAQVSFVLTARGVGPFDSYVGALALINALVAGAAARLRTSAAGHLDRVESAWLAIDALVDDD